MLGDHGRWGKNVWYEPSVGVPLIAAGPGIRRGVVTDALVSLHDLAATFLDYAAAGPLPEMDAVSLRPVLEGSSDTHRDHVIAGLHDWRTVRDATHKLVVGAPDGPLLYDLPADPWEDTDLAGSQPQTLARLQALLPPNRPERRATMNASTRKEAR